jgi:diguanylate cyclase (GGDEF)-like protein
VARFVRDPDEVFENEHKRSLGNLRIIALMLTAAGAAGLAFGSLQLQNNSLLPAVAAVAMVGFGGVCQLLLLLAEGRMSRERFRMQTLWQARRAELQDLAGKDDLTQLQNRRFFYEEIERDLVAAVRFKRPLSVLMMDVDDLKLINDEFGHQVGDVVLRAFGRVMGQQVGEQDIIARIGGDEFAIILPDTSDKAATILMNRLAKKLESTSLLDDGKAAIKVSASVGLAGYPHGGNSVDAIMQKADAAMYSNKHEHKVALGPGPAANGELREAVSASSRKPEPGSV